MKLSADPSNPNYHEVVAFVAQIRCNEVVLNSCVGFDTTAGTAECVTQPIVEKDGMLPTHTIQGHIRIVWRKMDRSPNGLIGTASNSLFLQLKTDWELRETGYSAHYKEEEEVEG